MAQKQWKDICQSDLGAGRPKAAGLIVAIAVVERGGGGQIVVAGRAAAVLLLQQLPIPRATAAATLQLMALLATDQIVAKKKLSASRV